MSKPEDLPRYSSHQFALVDPPECDAIMKGGITSGIVYPYAILEIATRYRFRSLGGTSAGAIAAAFAAAAEYARSVRKDPGGFVRLQRYCDELPDRLLGLFQPDPELQPVVNLATKAIRHRSAKAFLRPLIIAALAGGVVAGVLLALLVRLWSADLSALVLAFLLGAVLGVGAAFYVMARRRIWNPVAKTLSELPDRMFGFCSGLTQEGNSTPAVTDWLHRAIQDIAFGSPDAAEPLTFGHLEKSGRKVAPIELRMVATNLSMMRPHTLPKLGISAAFSPTEWRQLFPESVVDHLERVSKPMKEEGRRRFPDAMDLPVIVATRMSLSFPLLFKAVPLYAEDYEIFRVVRGLGGKPERRTGRIWMSDGGISSNFPIHLFDAPLPTRPTFAFSLDTLDWDPSTLAGRVLLPQDAWTGLGVQIQNIGSVSKFAWQVFYSAKDWQDQLLSGMTGQRERIAHIYLSAGEGGLNLDMKPEISRALMSYGLIAGRKFASGEFNFEEHQWRRLLAFYRNTVGWIDQAGTAWNSAGFHQWYQGYRTSVKSYKRISPRNRRRIEVAVDVMLVPAPPEQRVSPKRVEADFPTNVGKLRNAPKY